MNFDDLGQVKSDYILSGKISDAELNFPTKTSIKNLNLNFNAEKNIYKFEKILFRFNKINFNSDFLEVKQKNDEYIFKGNLKNKKDKINKEIIYLIFNDDLKNFNFTNTKFESISKFSFDLNKKFKIKNLKIDSKLNLNDFLLKYDLNKIKNYVTEYKDIINLKENKLNINYSNKRFSINGSSEFYIDKNFKNIIEFQIEKNKNKTNFK